MTTSSCSIRRGDTDEVIFGDELRELAGGAKASGCTSSSPASNGRMGPEDLERLCPDWREREVYISGRATCSTPSPSTGSSTATCERLHMERFQPKLGLGEGGAGEGGAIKF